MARKYFGTDGIRGEVGQVPMTADFVLRLGWAAGRVLMRHLSGNERGKVVIGKDTRVSGYMFESALEAGFSAAGVDIVLLGPLPTPAVAAIVQRDGSGRVALGGVAHKPWRVEVAERELPRGAGAVAAGLLAGARTPHDKEFKAPLVQRTLASVLAEAKGQS